MQQNSRITIAALGASLALAACAAPAPPARPAQPVVATVAPAPPAKPPEPSAPPTQVATAPAATAAAAANPGTLTLKIVPGESKLTYEVNEILFFQGNKFNIAIGTTQAINGEIVLDTANLAKSRIGKITIDVSQFKSDSGQRDNRIRNQWLESSKFPTVTIVPTRLDGLPAQYQPGDEIKFKITADTTVRETTKPLEFDVVARFDGRTLSGQATTAIKMSTFGFSAPDMAGMLKAEDDARLKLEFVAKP